MKKTLCRVCGLVAVLFAIVACGDIFESHPYDGRVTGETDLNAKNIARIEALCKGKDTIRFAMMSDTQGGNDEGEDCVKAINKRNDVDFVIHGGDISDYGLTHELEWGRKMMQRLRVPYVVILGNHDCVGTGKFVYRKVFGKENFAFQIGKIRFICLNTNAMEYDYSEPVPDFKFLEEQYNQRDDYEKTVFVMHAPPFNDQFNNNVVSIFGDYVRRFPKVQFGLNGHNHTFSATDYFEDGIVYYCCPWVRRHSYLLFTILPSDTYTYEIIYF